MSKVYSIKELQELVSPIAANYGVENVYLFGSYARGEAGEKSDIDLRIDKGALRGYIELSGFELDLESVLGAAVEVMTTGGLSDSFLRNIANEEVLLYETAGH